MNSANDPPIPALLLPSSQVGEQARPFLSLPAELILHCLQHLSPIDLVSLSESCRTLRKAALTDTLWQSHVNQHLPEPLTQPHSLATFRDLYVAHHAHWFLVRNRIWISDAHPCGKLIVARFNPATGSIEAHTVVAERNDHTHSTWTEDTNVVIMSFDPQIGIHREVPELRLNPDSPRIEVAPTSRSRLFTASSQPSSKVPLIAREILMDCAAPNSSGLKSAFVLATDLPAQHITSATAVWPPITLPAPGRTRNISASDFSSLGHRPSSLSSVSQSTFRIRRWVDYHGRRGSSTLSNFQGIDRLAAAAGLGFVQGLNMTVPRGLTDRRGDHVTTFGTISPEAYTPTAQRPWRGIYCGDYSGHGCEFILVMQPDAGREIPLPEDANWLAEWLTGSVGQASGRQELTARTYAHMNEILTNMVHRDGLRRRDPRIMGRAGNGIVLDDEEDSDDEQVIDEDFEQDHVEEDLLAPYWTKNGQADTSNDVYSGQLVAVKLTGDPHIPKGEITWMAPDLGEKGFIRNATDDVFRGARVVRSAGHIANRGFMHHEYIPSQLILASHDTLAMYWQPFGHISYFKRVNLDALYDSES